MIHIRYHNLSLGVKIKQEYYIEIIQEHLIKFLVQSYHIIL